MTDATPLVLIEVDDERWDSFSIGSDPHESRHYLQAIAGPLGFRPVLLATASPAAWRASYALTLREVADGRWIARSADYGGPWLECPKHEAPLVARAMRQLVDDRLDHIGVVSEVFLLGAWLPHRDEVASAWSGVREKRVCIARLDELDEQFRRLKKGRRSDITRAHRELEVTVVVFDSSRAQPFADEYAAAMESIDASSRWRFGLAYFEALASLGADVLEVRAEGTSGGAAALFLRDGSRASYLHAIRWGHAAGAPSLVLWEGMHALAETGSTELLLGGGVTTADDDALLRFKESFATSTTDLVVGARCFDPAAHDRAVSAQLARPLPSDFVMVGRHPGAR